MRLRLKYNEIKLVAATKKFNNNPEVAIAARTMHLTLLCIGEELKREFDE
jgi:hypothetical protein